MNVNILLFPNFETLDAFGVVEVLDLIEEYNLHFFSVSGGIISSKQGTQIVTEKISDIDQSGILLIPGGQGTRPLVDDADFLAQLTNLAEKSLYCLTVCTGSALLARTGLLNGKNATSNKRALNWVKSTNENVEWVDHARWVTDGKFYTSSGISAGIDMALGFVADCFGIKKAKDIAFSIEYIWNCDKNDDQFAQ